MDEGQHACPFCGDATYGMTFASPGKGMCRECDIEYVFARGECRECKTWMVNPEFVKRSIAEQHKPGCSLRDDENYCHQTDDEVIRAMGYEPNDARRESIADAKGEAT